MKKDVSFAIHPGGAALLRGLENILQVKAHPASWNVYRERGNMSSATILYVLNDMIERKEEEEHQTSTLALAFGPGLSIEGILLKRK